MSYSVDLFGQSVLIANTDEKDEILKKFAQDDERKDEDDPFLVTDLGDIVEKYTRWEEKLPRVKPFYAVKCNGDPMIVKLLAQLGTGFDCASQKEIEQILSIGVSPDRIVYANPCKQRSHVKYAAENHVDLTVVDNVEELKKISQVFPRARLLIRLAPVDGSKCTIRLDKKFGRTGKEAQHLLDKAKELNLNVVGVCFHVGSGCQDPNAYVQTLQAARGVFDAAAARGFTCTTLDIGGGFPGDSDLTEFDKICEVLSRALDQYFPEESGVQVIAEPGRYFVASASTLVVNVIGKTLQECSHCDECAEERSRLYAAYHVNDGVFGACNLLHCEGIKLKMRPLFNSSQEEKYTSSTVWGQTTVQADCLARNLQLPDFNVGDWAVVDLSMGAYTKSVKVPFNGMPQPHNYYTISPQHFFLVQPFPPAGYLRG